MKTDLVYNVVRFYLDPGCMSSQTDMRWEMTLNASWFWAHIVIENNARILLQYSEILTAMKSLASFL